MKFLLLVPIWLAAAKGANGDSLTPTYSAFDDASWAITHTTLSSQLGDKQTLYDEYIEGCNIAASKKGRRAFCEDDDYHRLIMNTVQPSSVYNYTKFGYEVRLR
jgi:hypothetical protein